MSNCRNCGVPLLEDAAYCSKCGASVVESVSPEVPSYAIPKAPKSGLSTIFIVIITVFTIMVVFIAIIAAIAVPQLLEARRNSNQRSAIGSLRAFATDQETYKADNATYDTIEKIANNNMINLKIEKRGYIFYDLIKNPNADYFAVIASPKEWGSSGKIHFVISSSGNVREWREKDLPFELSLPPNESTIATIEKLKEAR